MAENIFGGSAKGVSASDFGSISGGVSDLFGGLGAGAKAQGDLLEQQNYQLAAKYALQEAQFTKTSTAIQEFQAQRETTKVLGETTADVAGAGFAQGGSALDLLRDSASQGAMQKAVLGEQGLITEAGYKEHAQSFQNMAAAAGDAANAEKMAQTGDFITGGIKIATGVASLALGIPVSGGVPNPVTGYGQGTQMQPADI
jgi:hypothetical protein